jgi:hypothetical protein
MADGEFEVYRKETTIGTRNKQSEERHGSRIQFRKMDAERNS